MSIRRCPESRLCSALIIPKPEVIVDCRSSRVWGDIIHLIGKGELIKVTKILERTLMA
mgnify:CR=1 FL=1